MNLNNSASEAVKPYMETARAQTGGLTGGNQSLASLQSRLRSAKRAFTTRHIDFAEVHDISELDAIPSPGDVVIARVAEVRQHPCIENPSGRKVQLFPNDEIVVCYGDRYAPNQFEARVPDSLLPCHLVAGGGIASYMLLRHSAMKPATAIEPIGLLLDPDLQPINVRRGALRTKAALANVRPAAQRVVAVVGSSMDAGKTTTASHLIRGFTAAGLHVGACKVTGTGSGGDLWQMIDSGARYAFDFTDAGYASTYMLAPTAVEQIFCTLLGELEQRGAEVVVVEVADGLYQRETESLLRSDCFRNRVNAVFLAVRDALAAVTGCKWLTEAGLPLYGVSGAINMAPLSAREAQAATGLPVLGEFELTDPEQITQRIFGSAPAFAR